jgi:hypothetical protein
VLGLCTAAVPLGPFFQRSDEVVGEITNEKLSHTRMLSPASILSIAPGGHIFVTRWA